MLKVKVFTEFDSYQFEKAVNEFLANTPGKLIDIKTNTNVQTVGSLTRMIYNYTVVYDHEAGKGSMKA